MEYELTKELRDAGFPQIYIGRDITLHEPYVPTLSELIKTLADTAQFGSLLIDYYSGMWVAVSHGYEHPNEPAISFKENSPEEAVARLWLALQGEKTRAKPTDSKKVD
jgi:hypothetical protein